LKGQQLKDYKVKKFIVLVHTIIKTKQQQQQQKHKEDGTTDGFAKYPIVKSLDD